MDLTSLIIQLLSGAVGGNIVGALAKNLNLGWLWNSVAGILGGGIGGQILAAVVGTGIAASKAGTLDPVAIFQQVASGGVGGGILMAIAGIVRSMMNKTT